MDGLSELSYEKARIATLIEIYDGKLNTVGDKDTSLSKSWYTSRQNKHSYVPIANARNILRCCFDAESGNAMWTAFKDERTGNPPAMQSYKKAFCPCNARATNEYRERDC